ncbi:Transposon TX1 uncharacterized 149 kDa protein [Vitis vinifera]|uniref:Transposon TX1 uncharacterized 149 kDa protein n=1 Tax=Vitis vinifera TaxID=29760 RepID=A0A438E9G3_VITVI|nr:Transposon TX1 uncharacterized 149 kDa protein [Vitis vinifera]
MSGNNYSRKVSRVLPRWTSDHWPIVLETNPFKWGPTPFRFENMWLHHPSFKESFGSWWREFQGDGWEGHKFMRKLQFLKAKLKEWNKNAFGDLIERKKCILLDIANFDSMEQEGGLSPELLIQRAVRKGELEELILREEIHWRQKARVKWVKEGDCNSKFFHKVANGRRNRKFIKMDRDKAPGPDGFTIAVFQDCWDVIKEDLVRVFDEFHRSGIINQSTNASFIVLLPKKSMAKKLSDYRPISLITSLYKIIAKVLAGRLRGPHSHEIVDEKKRSGEEGVVFKIDFEKAYDHVSWDFLDHVMEKKGFNPRWRKWIRGCLSSVSFAILVNGNAKGWVKASRGIILHRLAELLDCKASGWPILYLGLPLGGNPKSSSFWDLVIERISSRLDGWQKAYLSFGGRITLIRSCLTHMPVTSFPCLRFPPPWQISLRNSALLGKWLWRYPREGSALWHQVILSIYGSHSNGWDANTVVRWSHRCPWKAIAQVFQDFPKFTSVHGRRWG